MMKKNISITAFFPCYNDAGTIGSMVALAFDALEDICEDYEVLVVDDGSRDHSRNVLFELQKRYQRLRIIFHEKNRGYGGALRSGFENSSKDYVFYTDGDGQYNPSELRLLVDKLNDTVDIVNGFKKERNDPLYRIAIGKAYNCCMKMLFGIKMSDIDCDFRLIKRSAFNKIDLKYNSGIICVEMVKKLQDAGFRFKEVGVSHYFRSYGKSQFFNAGRIFVVAGNIFKLWGEVEFFGNFLNKVAANTTVFDFLRRIVENNFKIQRQFIRKELVAEGGKRILDIGCGTGIFSELFDGADYTGIDIAKVYIECALRKYAKDFRVMDAMSLLFPDTVFDGIIISGVIHHLGDNDAKAVLRQARRVLARGGKILAIEDIPTRSKFNIPGKMMHYLDRGKYIRTVIEYKELFSEYFYVKDIYEARSGICDYGVFILKGTKNE